MSDELPKVTLSLLMEVFGSHARIPPALLSTSWKDGIDIDTPSIKCEHLLHTYAIAAHAKKEAELTRLRAEVEALRATLKSLVDGTNAYGDHGRWSVNMQTVLKARAALKDGK